MSRSEIDSAATPSPTSLLTCTTSKWDRRGTRFSTHFPARSEPTKTNSAPSHRSLAISGDSATRRSNRSESTTALVCFMRRGSVVTKSNTRGECDMVSPNATATHLLLVNFNAVDNSVNALSWSYASRCILRLRQDHFS